MKKVIPLISLISLLFVSCQNNHKNTESSIDSVDSETSESIDESTNYEESSEILSESESSEEESSTSESEVDPFNGYYDNVDTSSKSLIMSTLQTLMFKTHSLYTSYGDIRNLFRYSDADPNKTGNILCFYSRESMKSNWDNGVTYNREHVWPKARSNGLYNDLGDNPNSYKGPGSDLHHIRPTKTEVNEARGSTPFGSYVPLNEVKGDCARIIMYMYVHYSSDCHGENVKSEYVGNLKIGAVFTSLNLVRQWNQDDPVDNLERARNEYIYKKQGNRNPFIDHPEWVNLVLG